MKILLLISHKYSLGNTFQDIFHTSGSTVIKLSYHDYLKKLDTSALLIFLFYLVSYAGLFYMNIFLLITCLIIIYWERVDFIYYGVRDSIKTET